MNLATCLLIALFALPFFQNRAGAAQPARLEGKVIELKAGPGKNARTVETLAGGQYVVASNLPLEGYYKIRTKSGEIGWVPTESILLLRRPRVDSDSLPTELPSETE